MMLNSTITSSSILLLDLLANYEITDPTQSILAAKFRELYLSEPNAFEHYFNQGHFTGSAWVVSQDAKRVLLTHHRKLNRWLQLGGHADGNLDLRQVALREAEEESGLSGLNIESAIFDLDLHAIPAYGVEPAHWHYDVRFVVWAGVDEKFKVSSESHDLAWWPIDEVLCNAEGKTDASVQRMATKWRDRIKNLTISE